MPELSRRTFLVNARGAAIAAGGLAVGAGALRQAAPASAAAATFPSTPFTVGVASGDALPGAVVIWTRLTTQPTEPGLGMDGQGPIPVEWTVAETPEALDTRPHATGVFIAEPQHAWSVHVDVTGLHPDTTYHYRFRAGDWVSPVGRTRTTPVPSADVPVRFAILSCQNMAKPGSGIFYFNGIADLATRDDIDFVAHLGDYIYDFGRPGHLPPRQIQSLSDYRIRYGQYKSRLALMDMHARFPVYTVPDDHEFWNDVQGRAPGMTPAEKAQLATALQAYWENMPLRGGPPVLDAASGLMQLTLHRRVKWGSNLDLLLTDGRQYRAPGTILGREQLDWLLDMVAGSHAAWTAIGSGQPLSWFPNSGGGWSGFDADRSELTDALAKRLAARRHRAFNPVVLSGDTHRGIVTHVRQRRNATTALVATEFVGPPVTSNSATDYDKNADTGAYRASYAYAQNGELNAYRGYLDCALTSSAWTSTYVLGNQVDRPNGTVSATDRWQLDNGAEVGSVRRL
ncbi:alkaline phosphatase D family protein [Planotetraspora phitsanulokensis]|uniref:Alkaline phosphatase n=1 Tax=Planotetraspora phitsanulokensis TaxID=575192 RepID=A0A8J3XES3_9ACTN|nr:alkaline phosphatase D family protein [Planotetraspora phitsanulokensis]GII38104.1 alkaline phosphatase [Planotetraspora phitsanulokensis]